MASFDVDYDLVIETYTAIWPRYRSLGFDKLSEAERVIFCTWQFVREVSNGGFQQFFWNPSGEFACATVLALEQARMTHAASLLKRALAEFPDPPKDHEVRCAQLQALPAAVQGDLFNELTDAFFDSREDPYELQAKYVRRTRL